MVLAALVLSMACGADVSHAAGDPYCEMRMEAKHWDVHFATSGIGAGWKHTWVDRFTFGVGLEYGPARWEVQTELAYELRIDWRFSQRWSIGLKHRSNCKGYCDNPGLNWANLGDDGRNTGYNWLYLRRRF